MYKRVQTWKYHTHTAFALRSMWERAIHPTTLLNTRRPTVSRIPNPVQLASLRHINSHITPLLIYDAPVNNLGFVHILFWITLWSRKQLMLPRNVISIPCIYLTKNSENLHEFYTFLPTEMWCHTRKKYCRINTEHELNVVVNKYYWISLSNN